MFFLGYLVGSTFGFGGSSNSSSGGGLIGLIIGAIVMTKLNGFIINRFSDSIPVIAVIFICTVILFKKYSYLHDDSILRQLIYYVSKCVATIASIILGLVIFNKIGTPFNYIITHYNLFHMQLQSDWTEAFFQILGAILKVLDIMFRISFFACMQGLVCNTYTYFKDKVYLQKR